MSLPVSKSELSAGLAAALAPVIEQYLTEPRKQLSLLDTRVTTLEQRMEKEGLTRSQCRSVQKAVAKKVHEIAKAMSDSRQQHFANVYGSLKDKFNVGSYMDIPRTEFLRVIELVNAYDGSGRNWWVD